MAKNVKKKLKKAYKKLKYLDKTQATYYAVTTFIVAFLLFTGGTYSYFNFMTDKIGATTITIAKLKYELSSTNPNFQNNSIMVPKGEDTTLELTLKSLNDIKTKYAINYVNNNSDVKVYYEEQFEQNVEGIIAGLNSTIPIKIYIENSSNTAQTVNIELKGGYLKNELHSNITEEKAVGPLTVQDLLAKANPENITNYEDGNTGEMYTFSHPATAQTEALTDYRYIGANPNNWIKFNDEDWRIIGVFTVETESGEKKQLMKIIRSESIGNIAWDSNNVNEWSTSTLKTILSGEYYNRSGSYASKGLNATARSQIESVKWYLGSSSTSVG